MLHYLTILGLVSLTASVPLGSGTSETLRQARATQVRSVHAAERPHAPGYERKFGPFQSRRAALRKCHDLEHHGWRCRVVEHHGEFWVKAHKPRR